MKSNLTLLILILTVISTAAKTTIITGKINGKLPELIRYTAPVNGSQGFDFYYSLKPDKDGNFEIKTEQENIAFIDVYYNYNVAGTIIAQPGERYTLAITENNGKILYEIGAKDVDVQVLYNNMLGGQRMSSVLKIANDTRQIHAAPELQKMFSQKELEDINIFTPLYEKKIISKNIYDAIVRERRFSYIVALGYNIISQQSDVERGNASAGHLKDLCTLWGETFKKYPPSADDIKSNPYGYFYFETYRIHMLYDENNCMQLTSKDNSLETTFAKTQKWLDNERHEYYIALLLNNYLVEGVKEETLASIYDDFKKTYPKSGYIKFIDPLIAPLIEFRKQKTAPVNATIIENYTGVNSFDELLKKFSGKKLYIDVWATWCGPCRDEFQHKDALYTLLDKYDVVPVYISIDEDKRDTAWKKMINYYGLKYYHVRTNKTFSKSLSFMYSKNGDIAIPWHIIVDEKGNIVNKHAPGIDNPEALGKTLEQLKN